MKAITTAEELLEASGLGPCELIEGELIQMSPAGSWHGWVAAAFCRFLADFVEAHSLGSVFTAETGFVLSRKPDTVRAPDVSFVRAERLAGGLPKGFFEGPPDLAVEVLSPWDRWSEVAAKAQVWLRAGCRVVWIADPETREVHVHRAASDVRILREADTLDGGDLLPGFAVPVRDLFPPR